ncbi:diguanylate cyclase [Aliiglaciecola sp. CAU 1673]|uniref:diguanylate cyclase n=1 Tax=Aliiglaciecola sp. CAU 1673 TaxID=3032595 RepID=UPI0023DB47CA|nr:diguanylate cyclase [Aliiglaciecola sp. CAU 1673]MDF2177796.1 diguanylate cyclase [Aliiglaciecola sp. CAU 1673]
MTSAIEQISLAQSTEVRNRRGRILVVDDQPINIQAIHQIFINEHELFVATSGQQALDFCQSTPPDLLLLDVMMPQMSGLEVCRRLKQQDATADIPVIFVTGADSQEDENSCWEAGGVDFVSKPVNAQTLKNRVRAHLTLKFQADLLKEMAFRDGLTGVANRRFFDETLQQEWRRCSRSNQPISLILLDIDFFKKYNDTYGHLDGDECLKHVAAIISHQVRRPGDLVARYGGEEFAVILPNTPLRGAVEVAMKIEEAVRDMSMPHEQGVNEKVVSVSVGVATWHMDADLGPDQLIELADRQLYRAKEQGRARVCFEET